MKPPKHQRPFVTTRPPPSSSSLAARGLVMMKLKKRLDGEDADAACLRARAFWWAQHIAEERPYQSADHWVFLVRKEEAA